MKSTKGAKRSRTTEYLRRLIMILLCLSISLSAFASNTLYTVQALDSSAQQTREETKARLMEQIRNEGWDPYSEDMTVEEFYALMELFDEGKLPLETETTSGNSTISSLGFGAPGFDEPGIDEPSAVAQENYIPRTKFLFAGLSNYVPRDGSGDSDPPQIYDNNVDYTPGDDYPSGLDQFDSGYMRPPESWEGIHVTDAKTNRVVLVSEDANTENTAVAGNVIQELFAKYTGYYVKQVTIDGANINVLGMIDLGDRCIYYYLSAEEQSTQVSTTTLPDEAKFIIEYVPVEHSINYKVILENEEVTNTVPTTDVVFYGSNSPTTVSWAESIFGASRPNRTTDGAYSFDVFVPYGYTLQILISINMTVDIPYASETSKDSFYVEIDHTGTKEAVHDSWLKAYYTYLLEQGLVTSEAEFDSCIKETEDEDGNITLEWDVEGDPDKLAHDAILARMAERINDFILHNDGYPLGTYPIYNRQGPGGFKILPDTDNGPTAHTMNDTFYNHLVKADRTITAVLRELPDPTFDVSKILQLSNGAGGRGSSATEDFAFDSLKYYDDDYAYHDEYGKEHNGDDDPLTHSAEYPNIQSENDAWRWTGEDNSFRGSPRSMKYDNETGTYSYTWLFQTNSDDSYYLDVFEVNGIAINIPYFPLYNWKDTYRVEGKSEIANDDHPYFTETTLADGATLRLEFLLGWNEAQRHYRVTVTGARSNVVVTGLNLMQFRSGAPEFATYNLTGVYSDQDGYSQTAPAIEYYDKQSGWTRKAQSNVVIDQTNDGIDYTNGDTDMHGANIRFKITDGYGNPYYMFTNRWGDPIGNQTSVELDEEGSIISYNPVEALNDVPEDAQLNSRYIYDGGDGYYYVRLTDQTGCKFALLTVVARTIKYTVRYTPEYDDDTETWGGFVMDPESGELVKLTQDWMDAHQRNDKSSELDLDPESMPLFHHDPENCNLYQMAKDDSGVVPEVYEKILPQYDDNEGTFYDLIYNTMATIANDKYGTIRPKDKNNNYTFQNWILVGENFTPVTDENNKVIQFLGGAIDLTQYYDYAVKHVAFGNADTDIHVLRLMPVWRYLENPFTYHVVLNWVDNLGNIHADDFSEYWNEVVTEMTLSGHVYVFLNKEAKPLLDWIANHPTYTFWNDVNNAVDDDTETAEQKIETALKEYLESGGEADNANYDNILAALLQQNFYDDEGNEITGHDKFQRLGRDIFLVTEDNGTISIWMYESKGGLIFQKDVQEKPFTHDDEFYFTITNAKVGAGYTTLLTGEYRAYPQFVYDDEGNPRERTEDDALIVKFENGEIVSINGDENVTYFTLKDGEGISLYVSDGQYTVVELGSNSGGSYKVSVEYDGDKTDDEMDDWDIPDDENLWLIGSEKTYHDPENPDYPNFPDGISQVSATVNFALGEANVVHTLIFHNQTTSLSVEKALGANDKDLDKLIDYQNTDFYFNVALRLPTDYAPLWQEPTYDEENELIEDEYHYFTMNVYNVADGTLVREDKIILTQSERAENGETIEVWIGSITLKAGQRATIVMTVPEDGQHFNYWVEEVWNETEWDAKEWDAENGRPNIFTEMWSGKNGIAEAGKEAVAKVINYYGEPESGYLAITETGGKPGETFLYRITNEETGEELIVSVPGGGETIVQCPPGNYTVEEITDWAWRYEDGECEQEMPINVNGTHTLTSPAHADFTNDRNEKAWLGGENKKNNRFSFSENVEEII